jgi:hypothetical protein
MKLMNIRYVFSREIKDFIDIERASFDMMLISLSYLCSKALDPELSNADLEMNLISGKYRVLGYFASHWLALTLPYVREKTWWISHRFSNLLTRVAMSARNYEFEDNIESPDISLKNVKLERLSPEGYELLCTAFRFQLDERLADWNLSNST